MEWANRAPQKWGEDVVARYKEDISILQSLQSFGCTETTDGLSIHMQIEERLAIVRQLSKSEGDKR